MAMSAPYRTICRDLWNICFKKAMSGADEPKLNEGEEQLKLRRGFLLARRILRRGWVAGLLDYWLAGNIYRC